MDSPLPTRRAALSVAAGTAAAGLARTTQPTGPLTRVNVATLATNSPTLLAYREAVAKMRERPATDARSWLFQANMHGYPPDVRSPDPLWAWCMHSNWWFLPWHRGYLFYFERIVRELARFPAFALPYWRWEVPGQDVLPSAFRIVSVGGVRNSLFDATRFDLINGGVPITRTNPRDRDPGAFAKGWARALRQPNFVPRVPGAASFGGAVMAKTDPGERPRGSGGSGGMERDAHNTVHVSVASGRREGLDGHMGAEQTAARDPIFWLHHANVDRLWNRWLDVPGHGNPTDPDWLGQSFAFIDADGGRVSKTVAELLDLAGRAVRYDDDKPPQVALARPPVAEAQPMPEPVKTRVAAAVPDFTLTNRVFSQPLRLEEGGGPRLMAATAGGQPPVGQVPDEVVLQISNIRPPADVEVSYEVHVVKAGDRPTPERFVGMITFFGRTGSAAHHKAAADRGFTEAFDVTDVLADIRRRNGGVMPELAVTIVPRSNDPQVSAADLQLKPGVEVKFSDFNLDVVTTKKP